MRYVRLLTGAWFRSGTGLPVPMRVGFHVCRRTSPRFCDFSAAPLLSASSFPKPPRPPHNLVSGLALRHVAIAPPPRQRLRVHAEPRRNLRAGVAAHEAVEGGDRVVHVRRIWPDVRRVKRYRLHKRKCCAIVPAMNRRTGGRG